MKTTRISLILFFLALLIWPSIVSGQSTTAKYWIFLTDKIGPAGKIALVEPDHLTQKAFDRRQLRGRPRSATLDAPLSASYLQALEEMGIEPVIKSRWLNAVSAWLTSEQVDRLNKIAFVREIRPVGRSRVAPVTDDAPGPVSFASKQRFYSLQYGLSEVQLANINAIAPLERGINGAGVRLGFLDTEFGDFQHPVFEKIVSEGRLIDYQNFVGVSQSSRHGLSVASVAVGFMEGELIGPGYGADVLAATTEHAGLEYNQEEDNWVGGIEWLESQGVDVVNSSLGYSEFDAGQTSYTQADLDGDTGTTTIAADIAASLGVVVVNSAGNEGYCSSPNLCWFYIITPADGDSVIAVGAVKPDSSRASFSSFGPTADGRIKPDVSAPGSSVRIASSFGYSSGGGTSFASPLVAGVVCQILQVNPYLTPMEVRDLLRNTASQAQQPDSILGWGIINADAAILQAQTALSVEDLPQTDFLEAVYPNPFSDRTTFILRAPSFVDHARLSIYDVLGRRVAIPVDEPLHAGYRRITFDGSNLPSGVYIYVFEGDRTKETGRIVLVR